MFTNDGVWLSWADCVADFVDLTWERVSIWKELGNVFYDKKGVPYEKSLEMFILTGKGFHIKNECGNVYYDKVLSSWGAPVQWTGRSENQILLLTSCALERMFNLDGAFRESDPLTN